MSEQPQLQRMQQTMPEDGDGWHQINAGPHLHIMFHPNRQSLGREPDDIKRPSIVVAVAGKREQALRFDPFSVGSHYHIRPSLRGRQLPLWVEEGQKPLEIALAFFEKPLRFHSSHRPKRTIWRRGWMTPTWPVPPGRSGNSRLPQDTSPPLDGKEQAVAGASNSLTPLKEGEALDFTQDGHIELDGELPLNNFGGSLGTGRIHRLWHLIEGALQALGPRRLAARSRTPTCPSSAPAARS
jgi:hypothetical protein